MVDLPKIIPLREQIQRRNFLKGAGAMMAGLAGCNFKRSFYNRSQERTSTTFRGDGQTSVYHR